jgi:RNA polymerase sigma factor (sigma-70 family)
MMSRPRYFERLLRFLRRKGRSVEDAEDLIQEAMLRLHVYGQGVSIVNEEAFLRHTVRNLSIDQHRRERLDLRSGVALEALATHGALVEAHPTPEEVVDAELRLRNIRAVLDAVSRRTRDIYFAHRAGYSYSEIAEHMEISQITIKRHIARALLAIMEQGDAIPHGIAKRATQ